MGCNPGVLPSLLAGREQVFKGGPLVGNSDSCFYTLTQFSVALDLLQLVIT